MNLEKYQTIVIYESGKLFVYRNKDLGNKVWYRNDLLRFGSRATGTLFVEQADASLDS